MQRPHDVKYCIYCLAGERLSKRCLCVYLCYHRGSGGGYLTQEEHHQHLRQADQRTSGPWNDQCDEVLFCVLYSWYRGRLKGRPVSMLTARWWILCLSHQIRGGGGFAILNSHFLKLKAHTQCCSHCLNFVKEHITITTVLR